MKTYWDMTDRERSEMSEADVERFVAAELMSKGVLRVRPLELIDVPEAPEPDLERVTFERYHGPEVAFRTIEDARRMLPALEKLDTKYLNGQHVTVVTPIEEAGLKMQRYYSAAAFDAGRAIIEKASAARSENEKREREHGEARKLEREALNGLWEDWHRCRSLALTMTRVQETFEEYRCITGDDEKARVFLGKVFQRDVLESAGEWHGSQFVAADCATEAA
jgi:hypothetical protein